jgi:hypothetical protein
MNRRLQAGPSSIALMIEILYNALAAIHECALNLLKAKGQSEKQKSGASRFSQK